MTRPVSVKALARRQRTQDRKARDAAKKAGVGPLLRMGTADSFVNFAQKMGVGADNPLSTATYGFNPVTRIRTMLEWIHRNSWLGGVAVDLIPEDMTRMGVEIQDELDPEEIEAIEAEAVRLKVWKGLGETAKWGRLYGGAVGVYLVDGQDYSTPFNVERIGKGQFRGVMALDRWTIEPSLGDLIRVLGPDLGMPKFYTVIGDAPALRGQKIHYTRLFRYEGIQLPYWQRVMENMWGISVIERLYDRMVAFDSATTGAAQLVYKAFLRTYAIEDMKEVVSAGGPPLDGLVKYVEMMRRFSGMEGITLIDTKDRLEVMQSTSFSGLSDAILQFGQQISGALQIPLVRLFGQSPAGLNSTGESDLRMYYDNIKQHQEKDFRTPVTTIYRAIGYSIGKQLTPQARIAFRSLWQLTEKDKVEIANTIVDAVTKAEEGGLLSQQGAMKELQQSSRITGVFTNISDEDIAGAEETLPPAGEEAASLAQQAAEAQPDDKDPKKKDDDDKKTDTPTT